jgi:thioesterase domain-containing protein
LNVPAFLAELLSRDIRLWADGGQLRCNAPAGVLTPELRDMLRQRKNEILAFLQTAQAVARQQRAIVPMQPNGARTPVFAAGGHNGDIFCYRELVRHMDQDQPFFGLHPPGLDGHSEPLERIEDLAAYFADQIQSFQPTGPYIIAGYCAGGAVAFELAQQLLKRGAAVSFLALFSCVYPDLFRFNLSFLRYRVATQLRALTRISSFADRWRYIAERVRWRWGRMRAERPPPTMDSVSVMNYKFERATMSAVRRYDPRQYPGRVCLILPNREWLRAGNAALRWQLVAPNAEVYYGPDNCNPDRMLLDPDAPAIAELFRQCRDRHAKAVAS